jgi:protein-tyrosine phosphatase
VIRLPEWLRRPTAAAAAEDAPGVLFVCMGNICRSPMAEGVFRHRLESAGLSGRVRVDSAGTGGGHAGEAPDPRALRVAAARGYDLSALRARRVRPEDYRRHGWVLAMDDANLAWLRERAPAGSVARVGLLMEHACRHPGVRAVPDPYFGSVAGFEHVLDLLEDACDGLLSQVRDSLSRPA